MVMSQLSSFGTAFLTVFGVIFLVFRSARFGVLAIVANTLPGAGHPRLHGLARHHAEHRDHHGRQRHARRRRRRHDSFHQPLPARGSRRRRRPRTPSRRRRSHEGRASLTTALINTMVYGDPRLLVVQADGVVRRTAGPDDGGGVSRRGVRRAGSHHAVPPGLCGRAGAGGGVKRPRWRRWPPFWRPLRRRRRRRRSTGYVSVFTRRHRPS